jgi:hypothetical protein
VRGPSWLCSSVEERYVDIVDAGSSILLTTTRLGVHLRERDSRRDDVHGGRSVVVAHEVVILIGRFRISSVTRSFGV